MAKKYYGGGKGGMGMKGMGKPPEGLVMKDYPKANYEGPMGVRDNLEGLDMLSKSAGKKIKANPGGRFSKSGHSY